MDGEWQLHLCGGRDENYLGEGMMDGTKGLVKVGCCPRALDMYVSSLGAITVADTPMPGSIFMVIVG